MNVINALRIVVIVGAFLILVVGLVLLPRYRALPQYMLTTGLLAFTVAAALNEIYDFNTRFTFGLVAGLCGVVFTSIGLFLIRR